MEGTAAMAAGGPSVNGNNEAPPVISSTDTNDGALELIRAAFRALPGHPIKDLLSNGACARCTLRLFSPHEKICSLPSVPTSALGTVLYELTNSRGNEVNCILSETNDMKDVKSYQDSKEEIKVCSVCLGILQFNYTDDKGHLVEEDRPDNFTAAIEHVVRQEGHQFNSFSLEVSLPQNVIENEQAVWLYVKEKYSSESWFSSESISIKDVLKMSVTNSLEMLLGIKSNLSSSFRVRLTYTRSDAAAKNQHIKENNGFNKRIKTVGGYDTISTSSVTWEGDGVGFPREKVNQCCSLTIQCYRTSIYIGGRYLKYSRNVSQTRWIIDDERMGEASIEEIVGGNILPLCQGDNYKFHAAGREDIDVRMLGTGRPFLVEIQNARVLPSDAVLKNMEKKINNLESKFVKVKKLKVLGNQGWDLMREGEAEKQKQYAALVWISRPLEEDDVQKLSSLKDMQILQKTPIRVLHRRSPLGREKVIHWMRIETIVGSSQYFLLHLCTQAGTYIKEFVHGDLGRTHPSIGSILDCRAEILRLDVTDVKMDWFQE